MQIDHEIFQRILDSGFFDPEFYSEQSNMVASPAELLRHYLTFGESTGVFPSRSFDPVFYSGYYTDVAEAQMSSLHHYALHGYKEGRIGRRMSPDMKQVRLVDVFGKIEELQREVAVIRATVTAPAKPSRRDDSVLLKYLRFLNFLDIYRRLKVVMAEREIYSYRPKFVSGRWRLKLDNAALFTTAFKSITSEIWEKRQPIYSVKQLAPRSPLARRKVLHVIPNVFLGGSTQLIVDLFNNISDRFDMHVMTSAFPRERGHEGMVIHDLSEPTSTEAMVDLMTKFSPDLVHVHYWGDVDTPWYSKAYSAANRLGIPIIQNINTPVAPYAEVPVELNIYVSEYVRESFPSAKSDTPSRVIYPGINFDDFPPIPQFDKFAANSIGMVYRLEPDKLDMRAIDLFIKVVKLRPATRVFIVGGGQLFSKYLDRVCEEGVRSNFVFTGYVEYSDLAKYYKQFCLFVTPVWKESFGQVTPFAMHSGQAVAGFNVGAIGEILGNHETLGSEVDDTALIICDMLDNPRRLKELGNLNRKRAEALFGVVKMTEAYAAAYDDVLRLGGDDMESFPKSILY